MGFPGSYEKNASLVQVKLGTEEFSKALPASELFRLFLKSTN